jgi:uncharacterized repeat protein (TIGR01451 family)
VSIDPTTAGRRTLLGALLLVVAAASTSLSSAASAQTASPSPTPEPSSSPSEEPTPHGSPALTVSTSTRELVAQVGDEIHYTVTVANEGDAPANEVVILNEVPPEVDAVSVPISDHADDMQFGVSPSGEDIVWVLDELPAGRSVTFVWTGRAVSGGDLEAVNRVSASTRSNDVAAAATTFLGVDEGITTKTPRMRPVTKKVVVFGERIVNAAPPPGSVLAVTGFDPTGLLWIGVLAIMAGIALLAVGRAGRDRTMIAVLAIAATMTACVSSSTSNDNAAPREQSTTETQVEPEDEVKGKRLFRGGGSQVIDETDDEDVADDTATTTDAEPEPVVETVRQVKVVKIAPEDLPVTELATRPGDNLMSFDWDEGSGITGAASSVRLVAGQPAEVMTSLEVGSRGIEVDVTITNLSEDTQMSVQGHIVHIVSGTAGEVARLESPKLDVTLAPGASATVSFEYLLPSGSYSSESIFEAS